jgi:hypothetical protein
MKWLRLLEESPDQVLDEETGKPDRSVLGDVFYDVLTELRKRLLGDLDPRQGASA